ncbi:MAG: XRE family transcriptional regulator [Clostridiales bacterium]|nr:MAG: XRE family transcriptional regulator [Clostridiales bacterium]
MSIGQRIKQQREAIGMSQEELAQKLGYRSRSTINKIESGINDITQSKVIEFAQALGTTPAYLMGWEDETEKQTKSNATLENNIAKELVEKLQAGQGMVLRKGMDKVDIIYVTDAEQEAMLVMLEAMRKAQEVSQKDKNKAEK